MPRYKSVLPLVALLMLALAACNQPSPPPKIEFMGDASIGGYAVVDMNGNGVIDITDPPLAGAKLVVTFPSGQQLQALTEKNGLALLRFGVYNSTQVASALPMTLTMEPPSTGGYALAKPREIVSEKLNPDGQFLFTSPTTATIEYRAALPNSAHDIKESADRWAYYLKTQISRQAFTSYIKVLSLTLYTATGEYAKCAGRITWDPPSGAPEWWTPAPATTATYVKYDWTQGGIAVMAKLENGYLYLLMTKWFGCK
jgi:hypothetical protein